MSFFKKLGRAAKGAVKGVAKGVVGSTIGKAVGLPGTGNIGTIISAVKGARDELKKGKGGKGKSPTKAYTAKQLEVRAASKKVGEAIKSTKPTDKSNVKEAMAARREAVQQARAGVKAAKKADYSSTKGRKFTESGYEDYKSREAYKSAMKSGDTAQASKVKQELEDRVKARRATQKPIPSARSIASATPRPSVAAPQPGMLRKGGSVKRGKTRGKVI